MAHRSAVASATPRAQRGTEPCDPPRNPATLPVHVLSYDV